MLTEFKNEPIVLLRIDDEVKRMKDKIPAVEPDIGKESPLFIGGDSVNTDAKSRQ